MPVVNPGGAQPPPGYHPPRDPGDDTGTQGGRGGGRYPGQGWRGRFEDHPIIWLGNHPGKVGMIQHMLRQNGFNITADGAIGPQTRNAAKAYVNNVSGRHWSQNNPLSNTYHKPGDKPPRGQASRRQAPKSPPPKTGPEHVPKAPNLSQMWKLLHPKKYARQETNVQYNPILANLAAQLSSQTAQGAQNRADINHWYDLITKQGAAATTADAATAAANQQQGDAFRASLLNLIGGAANPGSGAAAAFADITSTGQRDLAQNQAVYDTGRQASLVSQAASAQTQQQRMDANKLTAIQASQQDALHQRAAQYALNLSNAEVLYNQQLAGKQAAMQQGFQNKLTRQTQGRNLRQQDLTNAGLAKELSKNGVGGKKGMAIMNDPAARGQLSQSVYNQLLVPIDKPGHGAPYSPKEAWLQMAQILNTATGNGPGTNAKVFRLSVQIYREYVGQFVQWYNNKTVKGRKNPTTVDHYLSDNNTPWPRSVWVNRRGVKWA
jgi:hypothetical protein